MRNFYKNHKMIVMDSRLSQMGHRVAYDFTPTRIGLKSDSILSRFCLASLILMTIGIGQAWAYGTSGSAVKEENGTYYVVYDGTLSIGRYGSGNCNLAGPGALLTFRAKNDAWLGTTKSSISASDDKSTTLWSGNVNNSYANKTATNNCNVVASKITFSNNSVNNISIQNIRVTMAQYLNNPSATSLSCGTADINSGTTNSSVTVAWCNVPAMTYSISGTDKDLFSVSVASNSEAGKYNTATFTVTYNHNVRAGNHSATLTISDTYGNYSKTVTLSGTTNKLQPTVTWSPNDDVFNVDDVLTATNSIGLTVTLSGDANYVGCVNNTATMLKATSGAITITAYVTGNDIYADKDITKNITITNLEKQYISWDQDFSRLKTTDGTKSITLNATSTSGLPVTYELQGDKTGLSLTHNGNTWTLTYSAGECTNTTIVAKQAGNTTYAAASNVSKPVKVIDPTKVCGVNETLVHSTVTLKDQSTTYNIDIPSTMTIQVSRTKTGLFDWYTNGFDVEFYDGRNGTGNKLGNTYSYNASDISNSKTISLSNLNIAAKSVKLISHATNGYNVTSVIYTKQKDCKIDKSSLSFETYPNTSTSAKTFTVNYANYPISLECSNSKFSFTPAEFGDCSEYGSQPISVTYTAGAEEGNDNGYIYVKDNTGVTLKTCTLSVSISKVNQSITSTTIASSYNTTDRVELSAVANSGLTDFVYSATPAGIASFDGNVMTFSQSGTIAITVSQEGTNVYRPCSTTVANVQINKVTPTIATNPTVATIKYLDNLNNNQLSEGLATVTLRGVANTEVEGSFEWTTPKQITDKAGDYTHSITFKPTNTGMYNNKVFDQMITISRADASIVMTDGSVKVKIDGINDNLDECKIDLDDLIASQTTDAISSTRAGTVSYRVLSDNAEYASIDGNHVFAATRCGEYTIEVTKAQTEWYEEAKDTFKVTVNKLDPVVVFDNTEDPQMIYTYDELEQPAARFYNGHEISRVIVYTSSEQTIVEVNKSSTKLTAKEVPNKDEGEYSLVTISAHSVEDDFYNESAVTEKHYAVHAKRSPVFEMDGVENAPVSKTLNIGETAIIRYNDFTDATLTAGTSGEHGYVSFVLNRETREVVVTAVKGNLTGDGTQVITLTQPGNKKYYERQINYTFTVRRNVSTMSLESLTANMYVEDTVSTIYTNLTNTTDAIQFSCTPEGGMKMEDGKLIALQAGQYTVNFTQPNTEYWTGISQSKTIMVSKINPQITWFSETSEPWYASVRNPFTSSNTMNDCPVTVTSSDETLAKYIAEDNKIVVYGTSGTVTFTLNQPGNYKYNPVVNVQKTFTIFKPNNGLPFTLTSSNWTNYRNSYEGAISWDNGVLCGRKANTLNPLLSGDYNDWSAKNIIIYFTGVPDTLTFEFENASSVATQYGWHFYQSSTGNDNDWQVLKEYADALMNSDGGTSEGSEKLALRPNTRYIKLEYHGNFAGRFKNVSVTERKEITPQRAAEDFGLGYNGNEPTDHILPVDWYNVNSCRVYIDGADADRFILTENTIYSNLNEYGTANLHVSYKHDANTATTHTATLHIVEELPNGKDGKTAQIALVGQTQPAPQVIVWRDDLMPMPSEGNFENAAYTTSGLPITLTSLNPDVVRVGGEDGLTLYPVSAGIAQVQAYQAGNEKWAEVTDVIEIEVTNKHVQFIIWNDNLSNLKHEEGKSETVNLHASSSVENMPITYTLDDDAAQFASISGNVITLTGWGSGTITAHQIGNDDYVAVSKKKTLVSRNPNAGCRPLVGEYKDVYTLHTIAFKEIELNGEPQTVEFDAKCDWDALNGLLVAEFYDNYWHEIARIKRLEGNTLTSSYKHFGPYDLHRTSTAVKIYSETGATMTRTFKNVEVTLAKYLELDRNEMNFSQMDMGATKIQSFYINYSNLTGALDVQLENSSNQFEVITTTVGEDCGDYAKNVRIDIKCTGKTAGLEENAIIVSNVNQTLRVPVGANVLKPTQAITWEPETNILTTDEVTLNATATSELAVTYESKQPEIAEVIWNGEAWTLNIMKYGDVTITASQAGNESWSAATDKDVIFHISRVVPKITEYPTADAIMLSFPLGSCALHGGAIAEDIQGSFRWVDEEQIVTRETNTYQAMFAPDNQNYYAPVSFGIEPNKIEDTQFITWDREYETYAHCADVIELEAVASSGLPITYHSSDSLVAYVENGILKVIQSGTVTIQAAQEGNIRYAAAEPISKQITLERNTLEVVTKPTASYVYVHHNLSDAVFKNDGVVKAGDIVVDGTFTWEADEMMPNLGTYSRTAIFTPSNTNWYILTSCSVSVQVISAYTYIGNGGWTLKDGFWRDDNKPDGGVTPDDIAVEGTLTVTEDDIIKVRDLNVSGTIILEEGASMTVTGNLILEASLGGFDETTLYSSTSGQLIGPEITDSLKVVGDVYFQLTFDPRGKIDYGWYDFTVPFEVDAKTGIFDMNGNKLTYNVDYAIMDFSEEKRAANAKYWNKFSGTLQPNRLYSITFDDEKNWNTFLFKKKSRTASYGTNTYNASFTNTGETTDCGWNGMGNGTLHHCQLNDLPSQTRILIYDHTNDRYVGRDAGQYTYAVGTAFFVQVNEQKNVDLTSVIENRDFLAAPARNRECSIDEFRLSLTSGNGTSMADQLWFSASEVATDEYVIGHDLLKMGTPTEAKVAQIWATKGGIQLCDVEATLIENNATTPLTIFTPTAGEYMLSVDASPENAMLYLTNNDRVIWNLTYAPYVFDLAKGTTEGYGLRLVVANAPKVATGVEDGEPLNNENGVRKVLIENQIYLITSDGIMYDITGKRLK